MAFTIYRIRLAVKKTAKKVLYFCKTFPFSRNKASGGAGASYSASPFRNSGPIVIPAATVTAYCNSKLFPTTCKCPKCVQRRAAPKVPNKRPDCDRAQVSARPRPPSSVLNITPPTPPSTIRPVKRTKDWDLSRDSARPKPPPPAVVVTSPTPPSTIGPSGIDDLDSLTDDEIISQMEELCVQVDRLNGRGSGVVQEDPIPGRIEALSAAKPVIATFTQPQATLNTIMVRDCQGIFSPSSGVGEPRWDEPYDTGTGRVLEVPPDPYCSDEVEEDDEDDDSETVTLRRLSFIKMAVEARG